MERGRFWGKTGQDWERPKTVNVERGGKGVENGEKGQNGPIFGGEEERGIVGFWGKK